MRSLFTLILFAAALPSPAHAIRKLPPCAEGLSSNLLPVSTQILRQRIVADLGRLALQEAFPAQATAVDLAGRISDGRWALSFQDEGPVPQPGTLLLIDFEASRLILTGEGQQTLLQVEKIDPFFSLPLMLLTSPENEKISPHWEPYSRWLLALAQVTARLRAQEMDPEAPVLDGLLAELRIAQALAPRWGMAPPPQLEESLRLRTAAPLAAALDREDYDQIARLFAPARARRLRAYVQKMNATHRSRFFREILEQQRDRLSSLAFALAEPDSENRCIALLREFGARAALLGAMRAEIPGSPLISEAEAGLRAAHAALSLHML